MGVVVGLLVPKVKQFLDSKGTMDPYVTKCTSMHAYKMIYSGAEYLIHFKYSEMLNLTYITMMYGLGVPLLFPVAALTLVNAWICERIVMAYVVR